MENCHSIEPYPNFYSVDRQHLLNFKPINKRLSCNFLKFDYSTERFYKEANSFLIKNFYSLFNYVTGEFTPNLSIKFDSMSSFNGTVRNMIQLGTKLLALSEFGQQIKTDTMFAIMLHEMWHKRFTNKDISENYIIPNININDYYNNKDVEKLFKKLFPDVIVADIFNVLEDYRIEKLGLREFPGYVFYFDEHRKLCIELHKKKKVNQSMLPQLVMEYLIFKILLPELRDAYIGFIDETFKDLKTPRHSKKSIMEVIDKFDAYIDKNSKYVYSDNVVDIIKASKELSAIIPKNMRDEIAKDAKTTGKGFEGINGTYFTDSDGEKEEGYEEITETVNDSIEKELRRVSGVRDNNKPEKDDEAEKFREEKLKSECQRSGVFDSVVIYNPKCKDIDSKLYNEARKMSSNLARNLGFLSAKLNQTNQEFELSEGDIDEDELHSISFSNNIFYEEEPKPGFEFDCGILIDESGSMSQDGGIKIRNAKKAALSCILSMKDSEHVNLFVYGHSQGRHNDFKGGSFEMYEYYNSKRRICDWKNVFAASASGGNADGYAIAKMGEIMIGDSKAKNKILIVISDGMPAAFNYDGLLAEQHVRGVVTLLKKQGIEIIQICIDNITRSMYMFDNYIPYDSMGDFIKKFREMLQKKLGQFIEVL